MNSLASIMDGLDLLVRRQKQTSISTSLLYLFKFYMLCELALEVTDDYEGVLKTSIDDLYLVTNDVDPIDMSSIQLMLWKNGDYFYKKGDYKNALSWYYHTSSILTNTTTDPNNVLVLSRKLAACYAHHSNYGLAFECLEKAINSHHALAQDFLSLIQWSIQKNDEPQKIGAWIDRLVLAQDFKLETLSQVLDFFYKAS
ncbi:unnamed protein product [Rhizopus stolonifer]